MKLNDRNAVSEKLLTKRINRKSVPPFPVLHFGVGAFHRAHQAWAMQNMNGQGFEDWGITGVCVLPSDKPFVEMLREQDGLYFVQSFSPDGNRNATLVNTIKEILHVEDDYTTIINRIASPETKVISFTITEGGYNIDYNNHVFIWETPTVQQDLGRKGTPKTVFRILAEGLKKRMETGGGDIVLMSCDNIQHNSDILKFALMEFLKRFDTTIISWIAQHVSFVKTMVDRITPAASQVQKDDFSKASGFEDNCLVVCEDFFQWVMQQDPRLAGLPYEQMGVTLVEDVEPYEKMKLRLLNGGHSLIGLLGYAMGYDRIHTSIRDELISTVYQRYCLEEVIPTLDTIENVRYIDYVQKLVDRFSNPMINDSTLRIISGSTDKLPKFVVPVILDSLERNHAQVKWGVLILAAWYYYLDAEFKKNQMQDVSDLNRLLLLKRFQQPGFNAKVFISQIPVLSDLNGHNVVQKLFVRYVEKLSLTDHSAKRDFIQQLVAEETNGSSSHLLKF